MKQKLKTKKERKQKKKELNDGIIKDIAIREIKTLFEQQQQQDYYNPKRVTNFHNNNHIKCKRNRDKTYHQINILIKLKLT